jgi:hypothetical protein
MFSQLGFQIGGEGTVDALAGLQNAISDVAAQTNSGAAAQTNTGAAKSGGRGRRGRGKRSRRRISGGSGVDQGGVIAHDQTGSMSPSILSGGRRRRRTLRRARRGSRVRRHKSRKENLFGGSKEEEEEEEEEEEGSESENQDGGRRRRRGKKTRGKTSSWIKHVMRFAKDNKMKYFQALKDKRCRATYKSNKK